MLSVVCAAERRDGRGHQQRPGARHGDGTVDGTPVAKPLVVEPGSHRTAPPTSRSSRTRPSRFILVDGVEAATYTPTPDCVAPRPSPRVSVAGLECPPPSTTVTLANDGDPESTVVFTILVNGRVVQESAPMFGGDTTTIVGDLTPYEDRKMNVVLRARRRGAGQPHDQRELRGRGRGVCFLRTGGSSTGPGAQPISSTGSGVLPAVGAGFGLSVIALGLGLVAVGGLLIRRAAGGAGRGRPDRKRSADAPAAGCGSDAVWWPWVWRSSGTSPGSWSEPTS